MTQADSGAQFASVRFTERLDEIGAKPSVGTVADSYDCEDPSVVIVSLRGSLPSLLRVA